MIKDPTTEYNNILSEKIFFILMLILVYSSAIYFFSFITADPDLWGHLRFGKELWETCNLHYTDVYSYTAYGKQWVNHEWFSELVMYLIFNLFGSPGLLIAKLIIGFMIVFIVLKISLYRSRILCSRLSFA